LVTTQYRTQNLSHAKIRLLPLCTSPG